jgi:uncharacterized protein
MAKAAHNFRVRTITFFLPLSRDDFATMESLNERVASAATFLQRAKRSIDDLAGLQVQTCRIATSPFPQWMDDDLHHLAMLDLALDQHDITFCALGPADTPHQVTTMCDGIIRGPSYISSTTSGRFSCSANLTANDVVMARACAELVAWKLATVRNGLGNFHFCVASGVPAETPFFPAAKAGPEKSFAIGLENGALVHDLLLQCGSIQNIPTVFKNGMAAALQPLHVVCSALSTQHDVPFAGIDTSINPSLATDENGSVAAAMEILDEVSVFGSVGTLAAAAAMTQAIQSLPGITHCGYSGLMLPVCEDRRLAELGPDQLSISNLLSISQVCGVGVDTVPVPGDVSVATLQSLFLDVAAMAGRWNKPLSCRVFPVVGRSAGEMTTFESPFLVNAPIFRL